MGEEFKKSALLTEYNQKFFNGLRGHNILLGDLVEVFGRVLDVEGRFEADDIFIGLCGVGSCCSRDGHGEGGESAGRFHAVPVDGTGGGAADM